ncbi:MAG: PLP-dependent aminotransferase family protein [Clostridium sp.]
MNSVFSDRIIKTKPSFVREILKVTEQKDVISFAGGLPNPISFPKKALEESSIRIIENYGDKVFQYSTTEGYKPLRQYIANRYKKRFNLDVDADDILITTGSQQGLDLMGKVLLNKGDKVAIERPGYLGAIQSFSLYEPKFCPITLDSDGINLEELENTLKNNDVKILYTVPNFQNPTGLTYSIEKRKSMRDILKKYNTFLIEDDPYGELRFSGENLPYIGADYLENSVLFGSFSKTVTPGMRIGYLCTKNKELRKHLVTAKQSSDLHTNIFSQYMIYDYLVNNDYEEHIAKIKALYKDQATCMINAMEKYFPSYVSFTKPEGGMFMWATLTNNESSLDVFNKAMEKKVAFVPGDPFYVDVENSNTFRLNYTNSDDTTIEEGIKRLGSVL